MIKIAVVGLGYVGLPLAVEFSKYFSVVGYDLSSSRVDSLRSGIDTTLEIEPEELKAALVNNLTVSADPSAIADSNFYIVTVPTPINDDRSPDLVPLKSACGLIGKSLKPSDVVVFESTVYPGCTKEECIPILASESGLVPGLDFKYGYSPERINPGDKNKTFAKIKKVVSGCDDETAESIAAVYRRAVEAGVYIAESIEVAEAAKVIENSQRDINIAFINELALIFNRLNISTSAVLDAASTKWNFLNFTPGLVGGHCIGVDPYYLAYKAGVVGMHPEVLLSGRRLNDRLHEEIARMCIKQLMASEEGLRTPKILCLGLTFKPNCPDLRNSRVLNLIKELSEFGVQVICYDPVVNKADLPDWIVSSFIDELPDPTEFPLAIHAVEHDNYATYVSELKAKTPIFSVRAMGLI